MIIIKNANIVNEKTIKRANILIKEGKIAQVSEHEITTQNAQATIIDANGLYVLPGIIDDQVHFREPGLTHKGDIYYESKAAIAGGITSYIEMPNTIPQTTSAKLLNEKLNIAKQQSMANYAFMLGGTNDNLQEIINIDKKQTAGIKLFLGSSTGNMLVDDEKTLEKIFSSTDLVISVHCEDEETILSNTKKYIEKYGRDNIPISAHPAIRSNEACYKSSAKAAKLARQTKAKLHIFHISTEKETHLLEKGIPLKDKKITAEVCIHHLWFDQRDYKTKQNLIKWNPAIKDQTDKEALWEALIDGRIDIIATDHAPHTLDEKKQSYLKAPSGGPMVQHSLTAMLEFYHQEKISLELIVEKMCHNPAKLFNIKQRGFIREGYWADLAIVDLNNPWTVNKSNILYKCGWSPFEGQTFRAKLAYTIINGQIAYENEKINESIRGKQLEFDR